MTEVEFPYKAVSNNWGTSGTDEETSPSHNVKPPSAPPVHKGEHSPPARVSAGTGLRASVSSVNSSSVQSSASLDQKWASFDESDGAGDGERHASPDSERQNLLDDVDALSMADSCSLSEFDPYTVDASSKEYYVSYFQKLQKESQGGGSVDLTGALEGAHPSVLNFFESSQLSREELSQVWALADLNQDGFLNLEEFCIAMHLIVLRKKAHIPVPDSLPEQLRPREITPPRIFPGGSENPTPVLAQSLPQSASGAAGGILAGPAGGWLTAMQASVAAAADFVDSGPASATAGPRLQHFTSIPDAGTGLARPIAMKSSHRPANEPPPSAEELANNLELRKQRSATLPSHITPAEVARFNAAGGPPYPKLASGPAQPPPSSGSYVNNGATAGAQVKAKSPLELLSPKGGQPPPPPPPRPPVRHTRSASLDLNLRKQPEITALPVPGGVFVEESPCPPADLTNSHHPPAPSYFESHRGFNDVAVQTEPPAFSQEARPMLELDIDDEQKPGEPSPYPLLRTDAIEPKERCRRLAATNAELDRELARLIQTRVHLESCLQKLPPTS